MGKLFDWSDKGPMLPYAIPILAIPSYPRHVGQHTAAILNCGQTKQTYANKFYYKE